MVLFYQEDNIEEHHKSHIAKGAFCDAPSDPQMQLRQVSYHIRECEHKEEEK